MRAMKKINCLFVLAITLFMYNSCVEEDHFGNSSEKKVLSFSLEDQVGNTTIDQDEKTISVTVSASANISSLRPIDITVSTFATIEPDKGTTRDFSVPVIYTVRAEDGTSWDYVVNVKQEGSEPQLDNASFNAWYTTPKGYQEPGNDAGSIWATGNAGTVTLGDPNVTPFSISDADRAAKARDA